MRLWLHAPTHVTHDRTVYMYVAHACAVHPALRHSENETAISAESARGQRLPARGIALFNKLRRKDVNKAAADK